MGIEATRRVPSRRHRKDETRLSETRGLLRRFGLRARKGLGQHFLIDEDVLKTIVSAAQLTPSDIVMEIGPGLGVLTRELARQAGRVMAVELDDKLAALLKQTLASFSNVTVINEDVLKVDPQAVFQAHLPVRATLSYKVVANLPYYIASAVLRHFLEATLKPQSMVVMVQKEVAEEIAARPGQMGLLSIGVQLYGRPTIIANVPARAFYPAPEVDSAIVRIDLYPQPSVGITETKGFFGLVRAGFSAPRKQMVNSLAHGLGLSKPEVTSLLAKAQIVPQRRAETLSLEEWARLWRVFSEARGPA